MKTTILVIDDQPDVASTIADILRNAGYGVESATSGIEGLEKATENNDIHLILLDIMMPSLDGYAVAERLRRIYGERIKIVFVTIKPPAEVDMHLVDGIIQKPFDISEVLDKAKSLQGEKS